MSIFQYGHIQGSVGKDDSPQAEAKNDTNLDLVLYNDAHGFTRGVGRNAGGRGGKKMGMMMVMYAPSWHAMSKQKTTRVMLIRVVDN